MQSVFFLSLTLFFLFPRLIFAQCEARLPTSAEANNSITSTRIVAGLQAPSTDFLNVVTIAEDVEEGTDYTCVGSLISPEWVITTAQCFILPNVHFVLRGSTSLSGTRFEILQTFTPPEYGITSDVYRDDIQLIKLDRPVPGTFLASPSPSPSPAEASDSQPPPTNVQQTVLPDANPNFNFMYINNNTNFAMDRPRYLRLKGFGITTQPGKATEPLRFQPRTLRFADLRTVPCGDPVGNDQKRRLCTQQQDSCGACYGDVGAPLFDVDKSGTFSVLVGLVTFGQVSTSFADPICTGDKPVEYTAVASYADWIREEIVKDSGEARAFFFDLPPEGITDTDLARDSSSLAVFATTSVIVILCLALLGTIVAVVITCVVRHLRKKRKRWIEGLQAEDSFVKAGEKDAIIVDPFEGIQNDQQPRFSFTSITRAVKGATDFSSRSIGVLKKALVTREKDEEFFEPRQLVDDAPVWLPSAWDKLFKPPSRRDLEKIHTIPTQRVVDDVLSGADKSVELTVEEAAYKAKRDQANLDAAWAKLEIQTSLRNLSEAGASTPTAFSPTLRSLSATPVASSPRKVSRNSSRAMSPLAGSGKRKPGDLTKADTLLAAFASIDAESEQVAEETTIDSSALRALAEAKRPNVLATLRRKFSTGLNSGLNTPSTRSNDRESDGEELRAYGSGRGDLISSLDSRDAARHAVSGARLTAGRSSRVPNVLSTASGIVTKMSLGSRHSSMLMDYFSDNYSVSDTSSDDEEHVPFEDMFDTKNRRYTEDRKPQTLHETRSILGSRSMRKSQNRSFESLKRNDSSDSISNSQGIDEFGDLSSPPGESSRSATTGKTTIPMDDRYRSLSMSTSSVSSDKRPRSATDYSGAGPSSQTKTYAEFLSNEEERLSVHMESEISLPVQKSLPDRAEEYRSTGLPTMRMSSSSGNRAGTQREKPVSKPDRISVRMEEESSYTDRVTSRGSRGRVQHLASSGTDTGKDRRQIMHRGSLENNEDIASVHMEDASLGTRPTGETGKVTPPADVSRRDVPQLTLSIPKQQNASEDRVEVFMEEVPLSSFETSGEKKQKDNRAIDVQDPLPKKRRPVSENLTSTTDMFGEGDALSVHMEDATSKRPSVRARINEFAESEKRARRLSEPSSSPVHRESNLSVAKLKSMWNEIARRNSEDSNG